MAIFSRRTIQRLINENATFVRRKETKEHVRKLNLHSESVLDTEWEIVLLNALSKFGRVEHEPTWSGPRPDIFFTSLSQPKDSFIADIVTVSDRGIDEQFPVNALFKEIVRVAKEHGLRENSFTIKIGHRNEDREDRDEEQKAKLPGTARFHETILNDKFHNFIRDIAESSNEPRRFLCRYEDTDVLITYDPAQGFAIVTYPHYKEPSSLTRNTVYNRLEEKAHQLSRCRYQQFSQAIIICDGGNELLRRGHRWGEKHIGKVISHFLRDYPLITFVLVVVVKQNSDRKRRSEIITTLYKGEEFDLVGSSILESIGSVVGVMPEPERDAVNAINLIRGTRPHEGESFYGGYSVTNDEIRISARVLMDFMAGRLSLKDFSDVYHFAPGGESSSNTWNPFNTKLQNGRLISEIRVDKTHGDRDDDWLVIRFGSPDPAITPFAVPDLEAATSKGRRRSPHVRKS
jgi:hypothetical protein